MLTLTSCEWIAVLTTPKKKPAASHTALAKQAENSFWRALHQGEYSNIPEVEKLLTAAYLENPNDSKIAGYLGFTHIWKITERQRLPINDPTVVNEIILARKYFADAVELNSNDARIFGFLGDSVLIEGKLFGSKRDEVCGYFKLKKAIKMWPEFNYFTAGYPMTTLDPTTPHFKEALEWQWQTLDLCAGVKVNRHNPDFSPYMDRETKAGPKRACWNSWIAPHNFEGFFMNMGDMLVKQGDTQTAIKIYNNAKLSKTYNQWPYRHLLENRIRNVNENVANFQKETDGTADTRIMFNSGYGCMACHQAK